MGRTEQLAVEIVGPPVQRANNVFSRAAAVQHDRLAMPAYVGQKFDFVALVAHEQTAFALAGQRKIAPCVGSHEFVTDVARAAFEQCVDFALEKLFVKVSRDWQLTMDRVQLQCIAQIGHSHSR